MSSFDAKEYWSDRLEERFSLMGVGWLSLGEPFNRWMYRVRRHVFLRTAKPLLDGLDAPTVLDVGSGTGFYVQRWQELGAASVTASDLTDVAARKLAAEFPAADVRQLDVTGDLPDDLLGRFDVVSAMDVLFHIVDDKAYVAALMNLGRLVKPGGHVILSENLLHGPEQRAVHQVSRTKGTIEGALATAGLQPVTRRPMFVLMNTPVDRPSRLQRAAWDLTAAGARRSRLGSQALGAALYPFELALVSVLREGPSTEVLVCRRLPRD